jgi:hypothetical protein
LSDVGLPELYTFRQCLLISAAAGVSTKFLMPYIFFIPLSYVQLEFWNRSVAFFEHFFSGTVQNLSDWWTGAFFYLLQNIYLPSNWIYRINLRPSQLNCWTKQKKTLIVCVKKCMCPVQEKFRKQILRKSTCPAGVYKKKSMCPVCQCTGPIIW